MSKIHKMITSTIVSFDDDKTMCNLNGFKERVNGKSSYYELENFIYFCKRYPNNVCEICMNRISDLIFQ